MPYDFVWAGFLICHLNLHYFELEEKSEKHDEHPAKAADLDKVVTQVQNLVPFWVILNGRKRTQTLAECRGHSSHYHHQLVSIHVPLRIGSDFTRPQKAHCHRYENYSLRTIYQTRYPKRKIIIHAYLK